MSSLKVTLFGSDCLPLLTGQRRLYWS